MPEVQARLSPLRPRAPDLAASAARTTDEALMRRAQGGEHAAFATLFDRHVRLAVGIARRICGPELAEDATQATFLSAWTGRGTYSPEHGTFRSWICRISRNRALDAVRANRLHRMNVGGDGEALDRHLATLSRSEDLPAQVLEQAEERAELCGALRSLPGPQREVIELAYFGGLSHSEIAVALDMPSGTVKGRMRLGLTRLRRDPRVVPLQSDPFAPRASNTGPPPLTER